MVMINLGSDKRLSGYVNYKFSDDLPECKVIYCDTLHTQQRKETGKIIKKIFNALEVGGKFALIVPDFVIYIQDYRNDISDKTDRNGYDDALELLRKRLYDNGNMNIFTPTPTRNMLINAGFAIKIMNRKDGNIEIEAVK